MQVAPGNTRSRDPENAIQNKAVVPRPPPAARTALDYERLKARPLLIAHQTTDHGSFLKSHLESEPKRFGNPLCQHILAVAKWLDEPIRNRITAILAARRNGRSQSVAVATPD